MKIVATLLPGMLVPTERREMNLSAEAIAVLGMMSSERVNVEALQQALLAAQREPHG